MASLIIGINTLFDTNPGKSLTSTGVFPSDSASSLVDWYVSSDVASPLTISTSVITGTGFMKCMPTTLSGRFVFEAIFVIDIDDVFDASITPGRVIASTAWKTFDLVSRFSVTASTTKSASASSDIFVVATTRDNAADFTSTEILDFSTS